MKTQNTDRHQRSDGCIRKVVSDFSKSFRPSKTRNPMAFASLTKMGVPIFIQPSKPTVQGRLDQMGFRALSFSSR